MGEVKKDKRLDLLTILKRRKPFAKVHPKTVKGLLIIKQKNDSTDSTTENGKQ